MAIRIPLLPLAIATLAVTPALAGSDGADFGSAPINLKVGGFVAVAPKYEGSDEYEVVGFPIIAPAGLGGGDEGRVQFRGPDDLRFRLLQHSGLEAGPLVGWRFDREDDDSDRLQGLGDIDGGIVVGGYVAYNAGAFRPFVSYHHQVSGEEAGGLLRFGAEAKAKMSEHLALTASAGASYADDDYMETYFSVSTEQAANSVAGLPVYEADAGVKDVFVGLSADIALNQAWGLKLSGRYSRLTGDAADSPIVEDENQFFGGAGITYSFGR